MPVSMRGASVPDLSLWVSFLKKRLSWLRKNLLILGFMLIRISNTDLGFTQWKYGKKTFSLLNLCNLFHN